MRARRYHFAVQLGLMVLLSASVPISAQAETSDPSAELTNLSRQIKEAEKRQGKLTEKQKAIQKELAELQHELIGLAAIITSNERQLYASQLELDAIQKEREISAEALKKRTEEMGVTLDMMLRFQRIPPEAWVALPGTLKDSLRSAVALRYMTHDLAGEAALLRAAIDKLNQLAQEEQAVQTSLTQQQKELRRSRERLSDALGKRRELLAALEADLAKTRDTMAALTRQSKSLEELISALEKRRSVWDHIRVVPKPVRSESGDVQLASLKPSSGKTGASILRQPAEGRVARRYGDNDSRQGRLQGIEIETLDSAQVVAPADGEVIYTGPFRAYGNIVILRHDAAHHTLLAGLANIEVQVGQPVAQGEPIGVMGEASDGLTKLYVELRKNARPVDPLPWLGS